MSKYLFTFFLFLSQSIIIAQISHIDSLNFQLKFAKHDTTRIKYIYQIGENKRIFRIGYWDSLSVFCEKILAENGSNKQIKNTTLTILSGAFNNIGTLAEEQNNKQKSIENHYKSLKIREDIKDEKGIAESYFNIGIYYVNNGEISKGIEFYNKSYTIQEKRKDKQHMADVLNRLATVYRIQGLTSNAIDCFHKSLKLQEEINNRRGEAVALNNIAQLYSTIDETQKAIEYYQKAFKINEQLHNNRDVAYYYQSIGVIFQKNKKEDLALLNFKRSLEIYETNKLKNYIPGNLINIAESYRNIDSISKSIAYAQNALKVSEELNKKENIIRALNLLASLMMIQNNNSDALKYCERSLILSKELNLLPLLTTSYLNLSKSYSLVGKEKEAYEMLVLYGKANDSLNKTNNIREISKKRYQFEYEKKKTADSINYQKEKEIKNAEFKLLEIEKQIEIENLNQQKTIAELIIKNKEGELFKQKIETENNQKQIRNLEKEQILNLKNIEQQKFIQKLILLSLILFIAFSVYILINFRKSKKTNKIIEFQKSEVEKQKHLVEEKHKEITDSINYAERIQRSFLATKDILNENIKDYFVLFNPKDVVSGDFYWAQKLNNGNFILATADSTGHGVPGAIMSLLNITSLEAVIKDRYEQPAEILNQTRQTIINRLKKDGSKEGGKDGMDATLISFDFIYDKMLYAAANNPIWIIRNNELIELKGDKMPVGKHDRDNISFTQYEFEFNKGDIIYTLTDGFPDQFGGPKGKKFMYKQLKETLVSISNKSMTEQKQTLETILKDWMGDTEQVDDITIIGIRV